ncbi:MAG: hypothetical protein HY644_11995 [Acidobacteria bacterium]|nr:hypothetical protein [Acidobacteriota bacterium]
MKELSELTLALAEDLWQRFRLLAMIVDRTERFVGMTPAGFPVDPQLPNEVAAPWQQSLAGNKDEIQAIALDLILRALQTAVEPTNFQILQILKEQPAVSFSELMRATRLNCLSLMERVNDLIQVGLAVKDIQTGQVQGTKAAASLLRFVEETQGRLCEMILERRRE